MDADMTRDFGALFDAHDSAIEKALDANRAALSLLRRLKDDDNT